MDETRQVPRLHVEPPILQGVSPYGTLPVKLMPARCSEAVMVSPKTGPSAGRNWMMFGGRPHSRRIL